jgi:prepilin-type N-terminal cleavage/methylation domain-containing protein
MNLKFARGLAAARRGWTLLEMTVVVGIGSLVMAAVMQTSLFTSRSFAAMGNYADLDRASRNTLDLMSRDIRQAKVFMNYYASNYMVFTNLGGSVFCYMWNPQTKLVYRITGTYSSGGFYNLSTNYLMKECDYFSFRIWQRNPDTGFTFPYSSMSDPSTTKLVDVSWRCKRRILAQFNTESVQTARIVLRN